MCFNYDENYFAHRHQGTPKHGHTEMVARILDHPNVGVHLSTRFDLGKTGDFDHVFWSMPVEAYSHHRFDRLQHRSDFEQTEDTGDDMLDRAQEAAATEEEVTFVGRFIWTWAPPYGPL